MSENWLTDSSLLVGVLYVKVGVVLAFIRLKKTATPSCARAGIAG